MRFKIMSLQPDALAFSSDCFFGHSLLQSVSLANTGFYRLHFPSNRSRHFWRDGSSARCSGPRRACANLLLSGRMSSRQDWRGETDDIVYSFFFLTSNLATAQAVVRHSKREAVSLVYIHNTANKLFLPCINHVAHFASFWTKRLF